MQNSSVSPSDTYIMAPRFEILKSRFRDGQVFSRQTVGELFGLSGTGAQRVLEAFNRHLKSDPTDLALITIKGGKAKGGGHRLVTASALRDGDKSAQWPLRISAQKQRIKKMQPLDMNPQYIALRAAHPGPGKFTTQFAAMTLNVKKHKADQFLKDLRVALRDCPEGEQLDAKAGPNGGWFFYNS